MRFKFGPNQSQWRECLRIKAFTLIELLIVVVVIAILAVLLAPALSKAKFQGKNALCRSNLRQLSLALQLYVDTYEVYPSDAVWLDTELGIYFEWDQLLERLVVGESNVKPSSNPGGFYPRSRVFPGFACPFLTDLWPSEPKRNPLPDGERYGYNAFGVHGSVEGRIYLGLSGLSLDPKTLKRESAVVAPSQMIAFGDPYSRSSNSDNDRLHRFFGLLRPLPDIPPGNSFPGYAQKTAAGYRRHHGRFNLAFCDGHVESEDFTKPFVASDEYLRRWNIDNQPHREAWR